MRNRYKKSNTMQNWYNVRKIMEKYPESKYYIVYGERKNGKTYSAKEVLLDCVAEGRTFMYVRRTHKMIVRRKMDKLFSDMQDVCLNKLSSKVTYMNGAFVINEDTKPIEIGYCTSLEDAYDDKGIPFNTVKYVLFDEFIDYWYLNNEIELFLHTMANIVRDEELQDVKIIMLGNTISMDCPYFEFFGINVRKIKRGQPQLYVNPKGGILVVEHTKTRILLEDGNVKKSKYFGFGDTESEMILSGEWETKSCETKSIDGIAWNSPRHRVSAYITAQGKCFEMSYTNGKYPVLFVRTPNIQMGLCSSAIRFNFSADNSIELHTKEDVIPKFNKLSAMNGAGINAEINLAAECVRVGRVVYDEALTGTVFPKALEQIV